MPEFNVRVTADTRQFGGALKSAVQNLNQGFVRSVAGGLGGILSVGAFVAASKQAIEFASQFNDSSRKLGVGVEFLQEAAYAAKQTGASFGDVEMALKRLQIAQVEALSGKPGNDMQAAFARLGVSLGDLKNKNIEQIFSQIAAHIQKANPSAQQLADTVTIMGRSADNLLPSFRDGFAALQEEARRLGVVLDRETIARLDQMGDRIDQLTLKIRVMFSGLLVWLQKAMRNAQANLIDLGAPFRYWGALAGGATEKEAMDIAASMGAQMHRQLADQIAAEDAALSNKPKPSDLGTLITSRQVTANAPKPINFGVDDLARLGIYSSQGSAAFGTQQVSLQRRTLNEIMALRRDVKAQTASIEQRL